MSIAGDYFEVSVPSQVAGRWDSLNHGWQSQHLKDNLYRSILEENEKEQLISCVMLEKLSDEQGLTHQAQGLLKNSEAFPPLSSDDLAQIDAQIAEYRESLDPSKILGTAHLRLCCAQPEKLSEVAQEILNLARRTWKSASLWWVGVSKQCRVRSSILRLLFSADQAPELLLESDPSKFKGFKAAEGLLPSYHTSIGVLIKTFFLLHSPYPLGFAFNRPNGCIVLLFGEADTTKRPWGLMELLMNNGYAVKTELERNRPDLPSAVEIESAFEWWVTHIDRLIQVTQDPANYKVGEIYSPSEHLCFLLGLERFFHSVQSMLANYLRDEFGRLCFFFDAQDIADGLIGWTPSQQSAEKWTQKQYEIIETHVPPKTRKVLLGLAKTGLMALEEVPNGFYRSPIGSSKSDASEYIRLIRNSHHSFNLEGRAMQLLASHDGHLPADLPNLALLYNLAILARPEVLFPGRKRYENVIKNPRGTHPTSNVTAATPPAPMSI